MLPSASTAASSSQPPEERTTATTRREKTAARIARSRSVTMAYAMTVKKNSETAFKLSKKENDVKLHYV